MEKLNPTEKQKMEEHWSKTPEGDFNSAMREAAIKKIVGSTTPEETHTPVRERTTSNALESLLLEFGDRVKNGESIEDLAKSFAGRISIREGATSSMPTGQEESLSSLLEKTLESKNKKETEDIQLSESQRKEILASVTDSQEALDSRVEEIMGSLF